jgi:hypothetical protein
LRIDRLDRVVGGGAIEYRRPAESIGVVEVGTDVGATALHEAPGQQGVAIRLVAVDRGQLGVEQAEQIAKSLLLAEVRGGVTRMRCRAGFSACLSGSS